MAVDVGAIYGAYSLSCCDLAKNGRIRNLVTSSRIGTPSLAEEVCGVQRVRTVRALVKSAAAETHGMECAFYPHGTFSP